MKGRYLAAVVVCAVAVHGSSRAVHAQYGSIDFPTSGSPVAQEHFIKGTLLLHSFEYDAAAAAFRMAQEADPDFAMAYWGEAMTYNHPIWMQQDRDAALDVLGRLGPTPDARFAKAQTARERDYLASLDVLYGDGPKASRDSAYAEFMAVLAIKYPDDPEAQSFYALAVLGTSHGGRDIPTYMRAAAVVEEVFRANPNHPGAVHYLIHSYDDPIHAPLGLRAARAYSVIAPAAGHAQHMTSHIFVALGMWDDVVSANIAAWEVSGRRSGHYNSWLAYGYLQQGRYGIAEERVRVMQEVAERAGAASLHGYVASMKAAYLVDTREWSTPVLEIAVDRDAVGLRAAVTDLFASGYAAVNQGNAAEAESIADQIGERTEMARRSAGDGYNAGIHASGILHLELQAMLKHQAGDTDGAIALLEEATAMEDEMPFEFGPPFVAKPSHELLGEVLLEADMPEAAQVEFERALTRAPRRILSLLGLARAARASGNMAEAGAAYREITAIWHSADQDLAEWEEVRVFSETTPESGGQ